VERWLILLLLVLGGALLLSGLLRPGSPQVAEPPDRYIELESGTFVIEQKGAQIGEESFTFQQGQMTGRFKLHTRATLVPPGQPAAEMVQELTLLPTLQPVSYTLDLSLDGAQERVRFSVVVDERTKRAEMQVKAGWLPPLRAEIVPEREPFILDVNLAGSYYLLFELLKRRGVERLKLTALVPAQLSAWPLEVSHQGSITLSAASHEIQAELYVVQAEGLGKVELYVQGDRLIGVYSFSWGRLAYRSDLFPEGFQVTRTGTQP
jgi:hypothetical protein